MPAPRRSTSRSMKQPTIVTILVLTIALIIMVYQSVTEEPTPPAAPGQPQATVMGQDFTVYFTNPNGPNAETLRNGPDAALAKAIGQARVSVDVAAYQLNLWSVRDALLDADRRGLVVRVVTDSNYLDEPEVQELIQAGIPVLGDRREGLMHDKFVILDREEVWTGSMNLTVNGAYHNDNNLVRIRSSRLAADYLAEFEEMFVRDEFGPGSPADTPFPTVSVDGTLVEVLFSPEDGTAAHLEELLASADHSIYFMAYSFTSDPLADVLLAQADAGVDVAGVMENSQVKSNMGGEYETFANAGLEVRLDGNPRNMHHKVFIVDESTVVLGSYNFSASAEERNDENTLIVHSPALAAQYMDEFERVFAEGK